MGSPFQTIYKFIGQTKPNIAWIFLGIGILFWIVFGGCFFIEGFSTDIRDKIACGIFAIFFTSMGILGEYAERTKYADSVRDTLSKSSED